MHRTTERYAAYHYVIVIPCHLLFLLRVVHEYIFNNEHLVISRKLDAIPAKYGNRWTASKDYEHREEATWGLQEKVHFSIIAVTWTL